MRGCLEKGVVLAALSSLTFSLCSLLAKLLPDLHPLQLSCLSFLGIVLLSGLTALRSGEELFPHVARKLLFRRSLAATLFLICTFYSVQLIPLSDASVLFYTSPAFTLFFAKHLLKEPASSRSLVLAFILMICVILVMKPPFIFGSTNITVEYWLGFTMALVASLTDALGNIILRDLRTIHFSIVLFNYGLMSFIQTSLASIFFTKWKLVSFIDVSLILVLVFLNTLEQVFMTLALKFEKAGLVALVQASDIVYGYLFQIMFFKEAVDTLSIFGAIVIAIIIYIISIDSNKGKNNFLVIIY